MAYCDKCENFDSEHIDGEYDMFKNDPNYQPDLYFYWHGDIEEDYDMGEYSCLCEVCFDINNSEGKIKWKDEENPFKCASTNSVT